ncbi:hypothetical protein BLA29_008357, partial [Euroglyphus maynei]
EHLIDIHSLKINHHIAYSIHIGLPLVSFLDTLDGNSGLIHIRCNSNLIQFFFSHESFPLYLACDTFGFDYLHSLIGYLKPDFKPLEMDNYSIQDFFERIECEFLDPDKPFWRETFRTNLTPIDVMLVNIQDHLIDAYCEKINNNSDSSIKSQLQRFYRFYDRLLRFKPFFDNFWSCHHNLLDVNVIDSACENEESETDETDADGGDDGNESNQSVMSSCNFCDKDKFLYCFVHNLTNQMKPNYRHLERLILTPNTFPKKWIERFLIKSNDDEIIIAIFTTKHFDPHRLKLQQRIDYFFPVGDPEDHSYRLIINDHLLSSVKRPL